MTESTKRKVFTEEFKNQLVQLYNNGKRRSDILREYGVSASAFDNWVKRINTTGSTKEAANRTPQEQETLQLRKENKQLRMENDILKQAALILGQK
jgi:Transposase and inactivated derivatives